MALRKIFVVLIFLKAEVLEISQLHKIQLLVMIAPIIYQLEENLPQTKVIIQTRVLTATRMIVQIIHVILVIVRLVVMENLDRKDAFVIEIDRFINSFNLLNTYRI